MDNFISWITDHTVIIVTIVTAILEVVLRLWKSDKIRSLFSYSGRILIAVGKLSFALSDVISKVVPDRRADTQIPQNK